jgi:hypothetical protein
MPLPDYKGNSIVNLMSSLGNAMGYRHRYPELSSLRSNEISDSRNIILIIIDGLGYHFLKERKDDSFLKKGLQARMTSVFPSTTASAVPVFLTGEAPQQHGLTGWYMLLREVGAVATILPYTSRTGGVSLGKLKDLRYSFSEKSFPSKINRRNSYIQPIKIKDTTFTLATSENSKRNGYSNLNGFIRQIKKSITKKGKRNYIYAYYPGLDSVGHHFGMSSPEANKEFMEVDKAIQLLIKRLEGSNSTVIITGDHGQKDTTRNRIIWLHKHPKLKDCLSIPLCGEPRVSYCYVHPHKVKDFKYYVRNKMSHICIMHKSENIIKKGYFGLYKPHPELKHRVGDFVLIMKENYVLRDKKPGKKAEALIGNHGGISKQEMFVPLIIFKV